ncbi:CdaR family protein [Caldibacillus lycopersici]|uniref:CdaR family protein n=1 Tax=Perspicuibacillus lycopersici TaxID=1325689 RepID=A0AAE3IUQ3_9BACI|nr:CdaR family protein [Perspicuibacillus lycopersici]MCU9614990.1 CdaR family protein [Perspicuibacillus lycopersici]
MDKFFDNLMESKWFVRGLALVLALLLYATAFIDEKGTTTNASSSNHSETIEDVPVVLYYDEDNFVVTGAPQTVDVIVDGNNSLVQSAKNLRDFIVYIDLTDAKIGAQRVDIKIKDISDKLAVRIEPATTVVNVQEKVTKEFSVEAEFNKALLEEGYSSEEPVIEPSTVKITGGKDVIDQISYVKAIIESAEQVNETFSQKAAISVLDTNLNKLDVVVEPDSVDVTIPVISPKKTVPVTIKQVGTPKDGVIIDSIEPAIREVVIFGKQSVLDEIKNIEIPVDISDIDKDTELTMPIELAEGVHAVTPDSVNISVTIEKEDTIDIQGVPIDIIGLNDQYQLDFLDPDNGQVDVSITGPPSVIEAIRKEDIKLSVNVSDLTAGEHEVTIDVEGLDDVKWDLETSTVTVSITADEEG